MGLTGQEDDSAEVQDDVCSEGDADQEPTVPTDTSTGRVGFGMMHSVSGCSFDMFEFRIRFIGITTNRYLILIKLSALFYFTL